MEPVSLQGSSAGDMKISLSGNPSSKSTTNSSTIDGSAPEIWLEHGIRNDMSEFTATEDSTVVDNTGENYAVESYVSEDYRVEDFTVIDNTIESGGLLKSILKELSIDLDAIDLDAINSADIDALSAEDGNIPVIRPPQCRSPVPEEKKNKQKNEDLTIVTAPCTYGETQKWTKNVNMSPKSLCSIPNISFEGSTTSGVSSSIHRLLTCSGEQQDSVTTEKRLWRGSSGGKNFDSREMLVSDATDNPHDEVTERSEKQASIRSQDKGMSSFGRTNPADDQLLVSKEEPLAAIPVEESAKDDDTDDKTDTDVTSTGTSTSYTSNDQVDSMKKIDANNPFCASNDQAIDQLIKAVSSVQVPETSTDEEHSKTITGDDISLVTSTDTPSTGNETAISQQAFMIYHGVVAKLTQDSQIQKHLSCLSKMNNEMAALAKESFCFSSKRQPSMLDSIKETSTMDNLPLGMTQSCCHAAPSLADDLLRRLKTRDGVAPQTSFASDTDGSDEIDHPDFFSKTSDEPSVPEKGVARKNDLESDRCSGFRAQERVPGKIDVIKDVVKKTEVPAVNDIVQSDLDQYIHKVEENKDAERRKNAAVVPGNKATDASTNIPSGNMTKKISPRSQIFVRLKRKIKRVSGRGLKGNGGRGVSGLHPFGWRRMSGGKKHFSSPRQKTSLFHFMRSNARKTDLASDAETNAIKNYASTAHLGAPEAASSSILDRDSKSIMDDLSKAEEHRDPDIGSEMLQANSSCLVDHATSPIMAGMTTTEGSAISDEKRKRQHGASGEVDHISIIAKADKPSYKQQLFVTTSNEDFKARSTIIKQTPSWRAGSGVRGLNSTQQELASIEEAAKAKRVFACAAPSTMAAAEKEGHKESLLSRKYARIFKSIVPDIRKGRTQVPYTSGEKTHDIKNAWCDSESGQQTPLIKYKEVIEEADDGFSVSLNWLSKGAKAGSNVHPVAAATATADTEKSLNNTVTLKDASSICGDSFSENSEASMDVEANGQAPIGSPELMQEHVLNIMNVEALADERRSSQQSQRQKMLLASHFRRISIFKQQQELQSTLSDQDQDLAAGPKEWAAVSNRIDESLEKLGVIASHFGMDKSRDFDDIQDNGFMEMLEKNEGREWFQVSREIENSLEKVEELAYRLGLGV